MHELEVGYGHELEVGYGRNRIRAGPFVVGVLDL